MKNRQPSQNKINFCAHDIHESSEKHVSGLAQYIDDIPLPEGSLHAYIGFADCAHGIITSLDLSAVRKYQGVVDVFTANSIPGKNDISPTGKNDEPILAENEILFWGQPLFVVVGKTREIARKAARLASVAYESLEFVPDIRSAESGSAALVSPSLE